MKLIKKVNYLIFGENIYLVGINEDGEKVFLSAPSWDCGWYWGFGYLSTYTNNRSIMQSTDISSHSHFVNFDVDSFSLNTYHHLTSCVLNLDEFKLLKTLMCEALKLGKEAGKTSSKEYKNLSEIHSQIINLLTV